jgi:hypothetical protein
MTMSFIYCLYSTQDGVPRYIGKTEGEPERRLNQHLARALEEDDRSSLYNWIRDVLRAGFLVEIHVLQRDVAPKELSLFEHYWMQQFHDLVNSSNGVPRQDQSSPIGLQVARALAERLRYSPDDERC